MISVTIHVVMSKYGLRRIGGPSLIPNSKHDELIVYDASATPHTFYTPPAWYILLFKAWA